MGSLSYEKYLAEMKSQKMITVYVTLIEVLLELFTSVVLAGVSIVITFWLMFEDASEHGKDLRSKSFSKLMIFKYLKNSKK